MRRLFIAAGLACCTVLPALAKVQFICGKPVVVNYKLGWPNGLNKPKIVVVKIKVDIDPYAHAMCESFSIDAASKLTITTSLSCYDGLTGSPTKTAETWLSDDNGWKKQLIPVTLAEANLLYVLYRNSCPLQQRPPSSNETLIGALRP